MVVMSPRGFRVRPLFPVGEEKWYDIDDVPDALQVPVPTLLTYLHVGGKCRTMDGIG